MTSQPDTSKCIRFFSNLWNDLRLDTYLRWKFNRCNFTLLKVSRLRHRIVSSWNIRRFKILNNILHIFLPQKYWNETYGAGILQRSSGTNISTKNSSFVVCLLPIFKQLLAMVQWKYWHPDLKQQTWIVFIRSIIVDISPAFKKFKLYFGSIFWKPNKNQVRTVLL